MAKRSMRRIWLAVLLAGALVLTACGGGSSGGQGQDQGGQAAAGTDQGGSSSGSSSQTVVLNGAGATFPYPLYSKWFDEYHKLRPDVQINYQSIGSGGGKQQITAKTVDFGASDGPMSDEELAKVQGELLHIPTVMGAVVLTYNLPGVESGLKLTPEAIAGIYLGKIKKWNDPAIASVNPGVNLPDADIVVVRRSDGSGTTNIFTQYLSAVSSEWKNQVGAGTSVDWPTGIGAKGNEGVATQVQKLKNSIGYVELAYAIENNMPYALVKNRAGNFVEPSIETVTAAAAGAAANMPADFRIFIVDQPGENAYPISGFTWLLVYKDQTDCTKGKALVEFLQWALTEGESYAADLLYAPLPDNVKQMALDAVKTITCNGQPILQ
ncbi:phosphate ABC transporter substrate-binding protein, PhoT family [Thermaerobacter marianensis DSM 12885]|uniref:Phosphate-binding protein n=1 Tax=Thermaerobacter marianensis (strain ATCC 700841 / DSM 12885 / JCM 10246 / 7p75a) TaxID=644966 RepID=E6SH94_THEM7|nr:phosphate ABC transporter substrate-binding protein PstS [Thermaerobacter marianensis]ADU51758.1 phosphate ABC transporter substrate-binding protein, PhoT family [Thermaerobacter marianensis DSM 12885]